tara:strand:- start:237 stop:374 length:138 start_codon:yes stop_codon:yes gene_type:complete
MFAITEEKFNKIVDCMRRKEEPMAKKKKKKAKKKKTKKRKTKKRK